MCWVSACWCPCLCWWRTGPPSHVGVQGASILPSLFLLSVPVCVAVYKAATFPTATDLHNITCSYRVYSASPLFVSLLSYLLATSKVISGWVPTCDSVHSWRLYSAAPLGNQFISTKTWYSTPSHHPDTEPTSHCHILIMPSTWLWRDMYQFYKSLVWLDHRFLPTISCTWDPCSIDLTTAPGLASLLRYQAAGTMSIQSH